MHVPWSFINPNPSCKCQSFMQVPTYLFALHLYGPRFTTPRKLNHCFWRRQNTVNTFHENNGSFERVWAFKFGIMFGFGLNTKLGSIQRFVMLWGYKICNKILKMEHQQKWFSLVTCKFQQLVKITFRNEKGQVLIKLNLNNCFYFFENKFSLLNLNHLKVIISV